VFNATIAESEFIVPAVPQAITSDFEALLRHFTGELAKSLPQPGPESRDGEVLLDAEIGDVRILVLRQGRPSPLSLLSPREQEIARMVAAGYPNKTIASVLEISSWTVASHLRRVFMKLQVSSRAAMATRLSGHGLDELPASQNDHDARDITARSPLAEK
jgi:DNA-binding CsgD family transcriptional regulator